MIYKTTLLCFATGALLFAGAPAQANLPGGFPSGNCKGFHHSAEKSSKWKSVAQRRARRNWSAKMWNTYGYHYRKWSKGQFRHYDCRKSGGKHRCKAAAYPCHV
jgi:hypothetical protein